jgi:hypothetical protein
MKILCGTDTRVRRFLSRAAGPVRIFLHLLLAAAREIFDESSYTRFLESRHWASTPSAYAAFLRETERARQRRPRCC